MLDKLIESRNNNGENRRLSGFLLSTFLTVTAVLTFGLIYSLFSQTLAMGNENLDVSTLVAPIMAAEPPPPVQPEEPKQVQRQTPAEKITSTVPTRAVNMQRPDESPVKAPESVSVAQNKNQARPNGYFVLKNVDSNPAAAGSPVGRFDSGDGGKQLGPSNAVKPTEFAEQPEIEKPPVIKQSVKPVVETTKLPVSGGVVNGRATNLATPIYPSAARLIRAGGKVKVQVIIDENGKVTSANAVSGHPLLRSSAENAAKSSKFTPTTLSKEKVKVSGIIIYNFAIQ